MTDHLLKMTKPETMEHRVLMCLVEHVGHDVYITVLWDAMYGANSDKFNDRERQQYVGGCVSRLNRKLKGYVISPGALKHTYRLAEAKAS